MTQATTEQEKAAVLDFWNAAACGEELLLSAMTREGFDSQAHERYRLEPYIPGFAKFDESSGLRVLEIGLGLGADHEQFARAGAQLFGVDLTPRAVEITQHRLALFELKSDLQVGDAEALPYPAESFDVVYSWGVIHHSPNTPQAASEIMRILRPGGEFRVMIYNRWSLVGLMLWTRYALMRGKPWVSLRQIYARYLESPGTKAYTRRGAVGLFADATNVTTTVVLTHGDLLESNAGQRHAGTALNIARKLWPRWILRRACKGMGLFLMIHGKKQAR